MPWRECSVMDEKLQFVVRRLACESMAELCRDFGISRKTGYKIFDRYQECGVQGLTDRSRRPYPYANRLPFQRVTRRWREASGEKQAWCIRTDGGREPKTETASSLVPLGARLSAWSMG